MPMQRAIDRALATANQFVPRKFRAYTERQLDQIEPLRVVDL